MDSCQHKDSKSSSDDADAGRSHACVFCKRGFTTAQALGGHMNIHRRDRAKIKQNEAPSISNVPDVSPISSHPPPSPPPEAKRSNYADFPSSTSDPRFPLAYHAIEDLRTDLSLQLGPRKMGRSEKEKKKREEDELDLELRLGHDP